MLRIKYAIYILLLNFLTYSHLEANKVDSLTYYFNQEAYDHAERLLADVDTISLSDEEFVDYCIVGAGVYHFKGNYKKALQYYQRGKNIRWLSEEDEVKLDMTGARTYLEIGDRKSVDPIIQRLRDYLKNHRMDSVDLLRYNLLTVNYYDEFGQFDKAMQHAIDALKYIEASGSESNKVSIYITIGEIFRRNSKPKKANEYYSEAEKIAKTEKFYNALGKIYNNQSIIMRDQGDTLGSIEKLKESARMYKQGRGEVAAAPAYYNLGLDYIQKGDFEEGRKYMRKVLDMGIANGFDKAKYFGFFGMGIYYAELNQVKQAEYYYEKALEIAKLHKNPPNIGRVYEFLYNLYKKNGMSDKALKYYQLNHKIVDSLKLAENKAVIENLEARYQLAQKEKENKELRLKQTRQRLTFFIAGGVIIILIIVLVFLYVTLRSKHRQNSLLALQKEQIDNKNTQLKELNDAVLEQKHQLEEVNRIKDSMFSIISHDLRSPLSSVYMLMRMIHQEGLDTERGLEMVKDLSREVNQALFLLNNLMTWANINTQAIHPYFEHFDFKGLMDDTLGFFSSDVDAKDIDIKVDIPENVKLWADLSMTQAVIQNLLSNAIKFSYQGDEINIGAKIEGDKAHITFEDHGQGIDEARVEEIFNAGVRLRKGTQGERGGGLGLNISKVYVEAMDGKINIQPKDKGIIVEIILMASDK